MSKLFDVAPSLYLMSKGGKIWVILFIFHFFKKPKRTLDLYKKSP